MWMMVTELFYLILVGVFTTLCGVIFTPKKHDIVTQIVFSSTIGFFVLSSAGLLSILLGLGIFRVQLFFFTIFLVGGILSLKSRDLKIMNEELLNALAVVSLYILLCLILLSNTIAWMGGDQVGHATRIRDFIEGEENTVSVYPFGAKTDYYPKAFHSYTSFWIRMLPSLSILTALKIIPILISSFSALAFYTLVRSLSSNKTAFYSLLFFTFASIQHYGYLIWAGYPAMAAELLMLVFLLSTIKFKLASPFFLVAIALTHTRFLVYALGVFFTWTWIKSILGERKWIPVLTAATIVGVWATAQFGFLNTTYGGFNQLPEILKDLQYLFMWAPQVLAAFALILAFKKRKKIHLLALSLIAAPILLSIAADTSILDVPIQPDRALNQAYIGASILSGVFLSWIMEKFNNKKVFHAITILLLIISSTAMFFVFDRYTTTWSLSSKDTNAINWLTEKHEPENTLIVTMDSVGKWIYPLTGLETTSITAKKIEKNPSDKKSIEKLTSLSKKHSHLLLFSSSINRLDPDFEPPFRRHVEYYYGDINLTEFEETGFYKTLYNRDGVYILEFVPSNSSSI